MGKGHRLCWFVAALIAGEGVRIELRCQDQQAEPERDHKHQRYEWTAEVLHYYRRLWKWPGHLVSPSHRWDGAATPAGFQSHSNAPTEVCARGRATVPPRHAPGA